METLKTLALWLGPAIAASAIWAFWDWLVRLICGERRPRVVALLMLATIAVPCLILVVLFNMERMAPSGAQ